MTEAGSEEADAAEEEPEPSETEQEEPTEPEMAEPAEQEEGLIKDGETIPILGWGKPEVEEFQELWSKMIGTTNEELKLLGINLLIWMFEHVPNMKALFKNFDASKNKELLVSDEKFLKHTQRVVVQLNKLIKKLDKPAVFVEEIKIISRTHLALKPQVTLQFFEDFKNNFHLLIYDVTGTDKRGRPATLWFQFLDAFCQIFKAEQDIVCPGNAKTVEKSGCCSIL